MGLDTQVCKILILDIETSPKLAYIWRAWKENIPHNRMLEQQDIMCFAAKWLHEKDVMLFSTRGVGDQRIVEELIRLIDEADVVIAHNAKGFDIRQANTRAIINGTPPPSPYAVVDTLEVAKRKFMFTHNSLEALAEVLGCTPKSKHEKFVGFDLWKECLELNQEAWKEMEEYNIQDVLTLEEVYLKMLPWIDRHPNVALHTLQEYKCPKCGGETVKRGIRHTHATAYQRYRCKDCGGWSQSRTQHLPLSVRRNILTN